MIAWIETVSETEADGRLRALYDRVKTPHGTVGNALKAHSLRPHTLEGHLALHASVLKHPANTLAPWYLETVASYTSVLNRCHYSLAHCFARLRRLLDDETRADAIYGALQADRPEEVFEDKELALLQYARKLTVSAGAMQESDIEALRAAGARDGEILEVNQVCAYCNYANRVLNGLGVSTDGEMIGCYAGS